MFNNGPALVAQTAPAVAPKTVPARAVSATGMPADFITHHGHGAALKDSSRCLDSTRVGLA
ncbi:hypothetical protein N7451_012356 [Penicillium sp. IBT 35674x]|nr:hypothetical protein N7451_012356 [Penicillium sp. IBT 35674x]